MTAAEVRKQDAKVTLFLKSWKPSLTCSIVSFKPNVGQLFVRVETEAEDKNRLYLAGVYQEFVTQVFYHFLKLNPHTKKSIDTSYRKQRKKKSLNFAGCHILSRHNKVMSEFQTNKMSWKPKKGSLQKPTVVVFSSNLFIVCYQNVTLTLPLQSFVILKKKLGYLPLLTIIFQRFLLAVKVAICSFFTFW